MCEIRDKGKDKMVRVQNLKDKNPSGATSITKYRDYLVEALCQLGGKACTKSVYDLAFFEMALKDEDMEHRKSSNTELIYKNNLQYVREELVEDGILKPYIKGINHGIWEFTEEGYRLFGKCI